MIVDSVVSEKLKGLISKNSGRILSGLLVSFKFKFYTFITFFFVAFCVGCKEESNGKAANKKLTPLQELKQRTLRDLVFVDGGTFMMGDVGYTDEAGVHRDLSRGRLSSPAHPVTLTSYSIQKFEVTIHDHDLFSDDQRRELMAKKYRGDDFMKPDHPIRDVLWQEARDYCQWLGNLVGYPMDLPTEAQWEFAARSRGKAVVHATNDGDIEYGVNYRDPRNNTFGHKVGIWPPNPLGLHDMTGNVMEWTLDDLTIYKKSDIPLVDPVYLEEDDIVTKRIARGSGVLAGKGLLDLYQRFPKDPNKRNGDIGFRCVANHSKPVQ